MRLLLRPVEGYRPMVDTTPFGMKEWRSLMGLTLAKAADELGVARSTVQLYEKHPEKVPKVIHLACA